MRLFIRYNDGKSETVEFADSCRVVHGVGHIWVEDMAQKNVLGRGKTIASFCNMKSWRDITREPAAAGLLESEET